MVKMTSRGWLSASCPRNPKLTAPSEIPWDGRRHAGGMKKAVM